MANQYPRWKNGLLILLAGLAFLYALPNWYGDAPAVQISREDGAPIAESTRAAVIAALQAANIPYDSLQSTAEGIVIHFSNTETQLQAREFIACHLDNQHVVALSLISQTPKWLSAIGAKPMRLGLDLRGGIHFLLEVDVEALLTSRMQTTQRELINSLRENRLRYASIHMAHNQQAITLRFHDREILSKAQQIIKREFPDLTLSSTSETPLHLLVQLSDQSYHELRQYAVEQTMLVLRNRVNELGIGEAVVQQQGANRIAVDLPGVQDAARAKQILGGTTTLSFHLVEQIVPADVPLRNLPLGTKLVDYPAENMKLIVQTRSLLSGSSIVGAMATLSEENGRPAVNVRVAGDEISTFHRLTGRNLGKQMAILSTETKITERLVNGEPVRARETIERVISAATILNALGTNFVITNLGSMREAQDLAILLRAGALIAPIDTVEERIIGPSLGAENIRKGIVSILAGFFLVVLAMVLYYRVFGIIAVFALFLNVVFIVAIMSLFGAVLSLPGIAGIVLTIGMAVDANVLIFERIREELRNGSSPQASIYAGFERAFSTIVDAQLTTLIVAVILFAIGTGPIKGFAVTVMIGIATSMLTAITYSRAMVNGLYGKRSIKHLAIGI